MATQEENNDELEEFEESEETDSDDLRQMIRDEIRSVLEGFPGEQSVPETKQERLDDEPLSLRAVESSVRRIVEEAMIPLREAQKKPAAKKAAQRKEPETVPEPKESKPTRKLTELLWGPQ
jgi:hypothetical protein